MNYPQYNLLKPTTTQLNQSPISTNPKLPQSNHLKYHNLSKSPPQCLGKIKSNYIKLPPISPTPNYIKLPLIPPTPVSLEVQNYNFITNQPNILTTFF